MPGARHRGFGRGRCSPAEGSCLVGCIAVVAAVRAVYLRHACMQRQVPVCDAELSEYGWQRRMLPESSSLSHSHVVVGLTTLVSRDVAGSFPPQVPPYVLLEHSA